MVLTTEEKILLIGLISKELLTFKRYDSEMYKTLETICDKLKGML